MDPPTLRELELEALLRERDAKLLEATNEVTRLKKYLSQRPEPSTSAPITLPPPLVSVLLPHLTKPATSGEAGSTTINTALKQRVQLLQAENDELYGLLGKGETGRLKEETRSLRRIVEKLENALRESHDVIKTLSTELEQSYQAALATARENNSRKAYASSPRSTFQQAIASTAPSNGSSSLRPPPTGPRSHKKPRLQYPQSGQANPPNSPPSPSRQRYRQRSRSPARSTDNGERAPPRKRAAHNDTHPERSPRHRPQRHSGEMDVDEDRGEPDRRRGSWNNYEGEGTSHNRSWDRERGGEKDRDGNRPKRNGIHISGTRGGRSVERGRLGGGSSTTGHSRSSNSADRTLAERMGL